MDGTDGECDRGEDSIRGQIDVQCEPLVHDVTRRTPRRVLVRSLSNVVDLDR